jgi:hypothetical protein
MVLDRFADQLAGSFPCRFRPSPEAAPLLGRQKDLGTDQGAHA